MITRTLQADILHWLDKEKILIIKGSRQVGKTTLMRHIQQILKDQGKETLYFAVDQELSNSIFRGSREFFTYLKDQFPEASAEKKLYLFLDEFQYLKESGLFLKTLFDQSRDWLQLIVSGSSSLEITKNSEFMTGRTIDFRLQPLSYYEFISYKTGLKLPRTIPLSDFATLQDFYRLYHQPLRLHLLEYFSFGGYPEVVVTPSQVDKERIVKELFHTYIEKDIIAFLRIGNVRGFQHLLKILADQIGSLVKRSELSSTLELRMETVKKYLGILEGTYVIDMVVPYVTNMRKQLTKMPKVYFSDLGLRNLLIGKSMPISLISGSERENFVYQSLRSRYDQDQVRFYRTISKAEIDFIVEDHQRVIALEVKSASKNISVPRVFRNLRKDVAVIVTDDLLEKRDGVLYIPMVLIPFLKL